MVRFIIIYTSQNKNLLEIIYIPIWLDLLLSGFEEYTSEIAYLHSNMVRFIIYEEYTRKLDKVSFTFQYG